MTTPNTTTGIKQPPKLTRGEHRLLNLTVLLLLAVGSIGLFVSFESVSAKAAGWGFTTPQLLPIAIDLAIPGFTIAHLLLIRMDMELAWVRIVPHALTLVTVKLNIEAGTSTPAKIGHAALPLVWVVCSEIAGHVYRVLIGQATGKRMERIRRSRFLLAPFTTIALWRRMVLWEETSYGNALARERDRVLARADLRERHGRRWRWTAPIRKRALLRLGELAPMASDGATPERHEGALEGATDGLKPIYLERHESAPQAPAMAPLPTATERHTPAIEAPTVAPTDATGGATEAPWRPAPERHQSATHGAGIDLTKRHHSAPRSATEAPAKAPRKRPTTATDGATGAPRKAPAKRPEGTPRERAADAIKALYTDLGRRPLESEMVAALKKAKLPHSRQFANARRLEIEKADPSLAALGSDNVRALTGTDN